MQSLVMLFDFYCLVILSGQWWTSSFHSSMSQIDGFLPWNISCAVDFFMQANPDSSSSSVPINHLIIMNLLNIFKYKWYVEISWWKSAMGKILVQDWRQYSQCISSHSLVRLQWWNHLWITSQTTQGGICEQHSSTCILIKNTVVIRRIYISVLI